MIQGKKLTPLKKEGQLLCLRDYSQPLNKLPRYLLAIVGEQDLLVIDGCLDVNRLAPQGIYIRQGTFDVFQIQLYGFILVYEIELARALVIAILNCNVGEAAVDA